MPIKSYLVYPTEGEKASLEAKLIKFKSCEVFPSKNKDLLVLVTDTESTFVEDELLEKIKNIPELKHFSMVSGFDDAGLSISPESNN